MNTFYQDWEPVVIRNKNSAKAQNKEIYHTTAKPMGNKEFKRLDTEEIPALKK